MDDVNKENILGVYPCKSEQEACVWLFWVSRRKRTAYSIEGLFWVNCNVFEGREWGGEETNIHGFMRVRRIMYLFKAVHFKTMRRWLYSAFHCYIFLWVISHAHTNTLFKPVLCPWANLYQVLKILATQTTWLSPSTWQKAKLAALSALLSRLQHGQSGYETTTTTRRRLRLCSDKAKHSSTKHKQQNIHPTFAAQQGWRRRRLRQHNAVLSYRTVCLNFMPEKYHQHCSQITAPCCVI